MRFLIKLSLILIISSLSHGCSSNDDPNNDETLNIKNKLVEMLPESIQLNSINATDIEGYYEVNFEGV